MLEGGFWIFWIISLTETPLGLSPKDAPGTWPLFPEDFMLILGASGGEGEGGLSFFDMREVATPALPKDNGPRPLPKVL
jgi:hypothetical protein